jgi:hypothetical protein
MNDQSHKKLKTSVDIKIVTEIEQHLEHSVNAQNGYDSGEMGRQGNKKLSFVTLFTVCNKP